MGIRRHGDIFRPSRTLKIQR